MGVPDRASYVVSLVVVGLFGAAVGGLAAGRPGPQVDARSSTAPGVSAKPSVAAASPAVAYVGTLALDPREGAIGQSVTAHGTGFAAGAQLDLVWQAFTGSWKVDPADSANFKGRDYAEQLLPLTSVTTDSGGNFNASFTVPDGFGFAHDVRVLQGTVVRNQASFKVDMKVTVSPLSGPPGTLINIDAEGIGVTGLTRSWQLTYDNQYTGWLSSVTTNGHAHATIPATGGPGKHVLKIIHGSFTFPYLNPKQSPDPTRPTFSEIFTVTDGAPVLPAVAEQQAIVSNAAGQRPSGGGAVAWLDRVEAVVGQTVTLQGANLAASSSFGVGWQTQVGVDMQIIGSGGGQRDDSEWAVGTVTTDASGAFSLPFAVPDDKGGAHAVVVRSADGVVAVASLRVRPNAVAVTPQSGPVGTVMTINLTGIDDTDTGKIFMTTYDNAMLGYSCSVTAQGHITIELPATGAPGWHFIDLYPGIYKGDDLKDVYNFRIPQLTYAADHPGEVLPAFHFAFEVTP